MECMRCKKNLDGSVVYYEYAGREDTFICMSCYSALKEEYKDQFNMCSHNPVNVEEPEETDEFDILIDDYEDISSDDGDDVIVPSFDKYEDISSSDPYGYKSEPVESVEAEEDVYSYSEADNEPENDQEPAKKVNATDVVEKLGEFGEKAKPVFAAIGRGTVKAGKATANGLLALLDSPIMMIIFGVIFGAGGIMLTIWGESLKKSTEYLIAMAYGDSASAKPDVAVAFGIIFLVIGCVLVSLALYRNFFLSKYGVQNNDNSENE